MAAPRSRLATAVPQIAIVAPIVAFAFGGTAVPIEPVAENILWAATVPVLALVGWSLWTDTRCVRTISAIPMIVWWVGFLAALAAVDHPRTSAFGVLTVAAIPVVIAFTWGQVWGVHDLKDPDA